MNVVTQKRQAKTFEFNTAKQPPSEISVRRLQTRTTTMPRRRGKFIPPPSHLSRVLEHLNGGPRLALDGLRRISLTLAVRNDHMGAR